MTLKIVGSLFILKHHKYSRPLMQISIRPMLLSFNSYVCNVRWMIPFRSQQTGVLIHFINERDVQRNFANNVNRLLVYAKFKGTMKIWPEWKKHTEQHNTRRTKRRNRHYNEASIFTEQTTPDLCKGEIWQSKKPIRGIFKTTTRPLQKWYKL